MATMYAPQNNSPIARTSGTISSSATTITVNDGSILPQAPNVLTLGTGEDAELVLMTAKASNILTVERGFNGTTAKEWSEGTAVYRAITAQDISALQENVDAKQANITASGILKGNGSGGVSAAVAGTDYQSPLTPETDYDVPLNRLSTGYPTAVGGITYLTNNTWYQSLQINASNSRVLAAPSEDDGHAAGLIVCNVASNDYPKFAPGEIVVGGFPNWTGPDKYYCFDVRRVKVTNGSITENHGVWRIWEAVITQ